MQNTSFIKTKNHLILNFFSKKAFAVVVFLCFALCVFADNYTWTGGGVEGKWDDPVNWGGSGYPGESDKAIFQSNTFPQITSPETITVLDVRIDASASLTIGNESLKNINFTISGTLEVSSNSSLTNYGTLTFESVTISSGCTFYNYGTLTCNGAMLLRGNIVNNGSFSALGVTQVDDGATIENNANSSFKSGPLNNNGSIANSGNLSCTGTITNSGSLENTGGTITGSITNSGTVTNNGGTISGTVTGNEVVGGTTDPNSYSTKTSSETLTWNDPNSWNDVNGDGTGDVPNISGDTAVKITLNAEVKSTADLTFNNSGSEQIDLYLNSHTLDMSECMFVVEHAQNHSGKFGNIHILGTGKVISRTLDTSSNDPDETKTVTPHRIYLYDGAEFYVTESLYPNGSYVIIQDVTGDCKFYLTASGANVNYGGNGIVYEGIQVEPYGEPTIYKVIDMGGDPYVEGKTIQLFTTRETVNNNYVPIQFKYHVEIIGTSTWTFTVDGVETEFTATTPDFSNYVELPKENGVTKDILIKCTTPETVGPGEGLILTIKTPDGTMDLAEIRCLNSEILWTGNADTNFSNPANWTIDGEVLDDITKLENQDLIIPSGCTNYPTLQSNISVEKLSIRNNASLTVSSGVELTTKKLELSGTGKILASDGTVIFTDSGTIDNPSYSSESPYLSSFGTIQVESGNFYLGSNLSVKQLNIQDGATVTIPENVELTVEKINILGSGSLNATAGKVIFTGTGTNDNPSYYAEKSSESTFGTLEIASGATFVTSTNLHITKALTNNGTFQAGKVYIEPSLEATITGRTGTTESEANLTKIAELICKTQGGKTLTINNGISVTSLNLSGTNTTSLLGVKTTENGLVFLATEAEGRYLTLDQASLVQINTNKVTVFGSDTSAITDLQAFVQKGWLLGDISSYSTITSSNTLNWNDPATWEDKNGDGEGDIPDISGEKEITITLKANVNVDKSLTFFNKGINPLTLNKGSYNLYYEERKAYLSQGNGTGPALDWSTAENWIGGEVPNITGSEAVSIILNGDMEASNTSAEIEEIILSFNSSGTNGIHIYFNGNRFDVKNAIKVGSNSSAGVLSSSIGNAGNLHLHGNGVFYSEVVEFGQDVNFLGWKGLYPDNKIYLDNGLEFYVNQHVSPYHCIAAIHNPEGTKFYLNASGMNLNWYNACQITFTKDPTPYGEQTFYKITEDGKNPTSQDGKTITFYREIDTSDSSTVENTFKYKVEIIEKDNTNTATWTLEDIVLSSTSEYSNSISLASKVSTVPKVLKSTGTVDVGDGIIITFRTPDGKMDMCEIRYIEGELLWTGASSTDILDIGNWSYNESLTVDGLTQLLTEKEAIIGSGAANYPVIANGVEVSKLTLKNGANITVAENVVLTVNKGLSFEGNSKIDASAGTVVFTGAGTEENPSFEATYPEFSTFGTLEVASGATFVTKTDLHITTALTNYGTFQGNKVYLEPSGKNITITGQLGDSLEIANETKISELYCENQADKNLIFNKTIAVDKLVLSGFANTNGSRLTIKDSSGIIYLSNDCFEAYYLFLADSSLPTIKNSFITVFESNTENILDKDAFADKNWRFRGTDVFIWTGAGLDNNWKNPHNWDSRIVPTAGKTVIIPADCSMYPILEENLNLIDINTENSYDSILVAVGASLDFNGKEVAISVITNNGTLDLGGSKVFTNELVNGGTIRANGGETLQTQTSTPIGITNSTVYEDSTVIYYDAGITNGKIINLPFGSGSAQTYINLVIESGFSGSCDRGIIIKNSLKFKNSSGNFDLVCENLGISNVAELSGAIELKNLTDSLEIKFAGNGIFTGTIESSKNTKLTSDYGRICFDSNIIANFNSPLTVQTNALDNGFLPAGTITLGSTCEVWCNLYLTNQVSFNIGGKLSVGTQSEPKDVYISAMNAGSPLDVEIAPKDATNQEFQVYGNLLLLNGNAKISTDLTVGKDMILLNGENPAMFNDPISGIEGLFAYNLSGRGVGGKTAAINFTNDFPTTLPKGTASGNNQNEDLDSTKYVSTFDFATGKTILVWNNFYNNGVDLGTNTTGSWNLKFPANDVATSSFAECYNATIKNCVVAANTTPGNAWLSTENCTDGTGNTNVAFSKAILANVATISDNIIRVNFVDGNSTLDEKPEIKIENSCNEISSWAETDNFRFNISSELPEGIKFSGIFADPECTETTDGEGDLSTFYLKYEIPTEGSTDYSWNTDATGSDPGAEESTDAKGIHKEVVPNLGLVRALTASYAGLRDEHKNRLVSVGTGTAGAEPLFEATKDEAPPVLVAVTLGQEQHETDSDAQHHYDSHNFIEWQFSEAVEITYNQDGLGISTGTEILSDAENIQSTENFGKIINKESGFSVAGFGSFQSGKLTVGSKTGSEDVNAFYRNFSLEAGKTETAQENRIRLSIAGYVDEGNPVTVNGVDYKNWFGFIDSKNTSIPFGTFTMEDSAFLSIKDKSENKNVLVAAKNQPITVNNVLSSMAEETKGKTFYGTWDIDPPVVANYMKESSVSVLAQELIPEGTSVTADCLEVHFLDNESFNEIDGKDNWKWRTRLGWKNGENQDVVPTGLPLDYRGGSRMTTTENETLGGIRIGTIPSSISAFTFKNVDISETPQNFKEEFVQKVDTTSLFGESGTVDFDTGYLKLYFADSVTTENLMVNNYLLIYKDGYVTDLAGNRMENFEAKSLDKNPPKFYMSVSGVEKDKVYILFTKPLDWRDSEGNPDEGKLRRIVKSLSIFDSSDVNTGLIDYSQGSRAKIVTETQKSTGIEISLTDSISYENLKDYYIGVNVFATGDDAGDGDMAVGDPITGNPGDYSMLYDMFENPIAAGQKHCLSDFAVNAINVIYAYDGRNPEEASLGFGIFGKNQWTITDFTGNATNSSKVFADKDISLVVKTAQTTDQFSMVADIAPNQNATGTEYTVYSGVETRLWLPEVYELFSRENNNSTSLEKDDLLSGKIENTTEGENITFVIPNAEENPNSVNWKANSEIEFLFQILDSSGNPIIVDGNKDGDFTDREDHPLFAVRLSNEQDLSSLDLWSMNIVETQKQKGGVTILNNVINPTSFEATVLEIVLPKSGSLTVQVLTLDGNVVKVLQRGRVEEGTYTYSWDGTNNSGAAVARGMYFIRIVGPEIDETRKVMVVR
ncbi:MAG: hypothetical protein J5978_05040 [Spirochaetaceae bacterium]|nr:hypothetical protein [Spirochaetaceae bacterium]